MIYPEEHFELCDKRQQFLNDYNNHILVKGGPGSGKTTLALLKARQAAVKQIDESQSVLFLSFSNAAIKRIADKSITLLDRKISNRIEIKTYHSFTWEILRSHGYFLSNKRQLSILASHDQAVCKAGYSDENWEQKEKDLFYRSGIVSFDQFAPLAATLVQTSKKIKNLYSSTYPIILVDEFQDTDNSQWQLLVSLAERSQIIAFGDEQQLIYSWRKNVHKERLNEFRDMLNAIQYDFGSQNFRSPESNIEKYAKVLLQPNKEFKSNSVIELKYCESWQFSYFVKLTVIKACRKLKSNNRDDSISIVLAGRSREIVRRISISLSESQKVKENTLGPIQHDVLIDQDKLHLATRIVAFLIDSKRLIESEHLAKVLDLLADYHISSGSQSNIKFALNIRKWAERTRIGKPPKVKLVHSVQEIFCKLNSEKKNGSPIKDWNQIRNIIAESSDKNLSIITKELKYLRLINKGSEIETKLAELWRLQSDYSGAVEVLENAIRESQILDKYIIPATITVMTMHQMKGKEYDAVILVEDKYHKFCTKDNSVDKMDTRKLLYMAITRAKKFAIILSQNGESTISDL